MLGIINVPLIELAYNTKFFMYNGTKLIANNIQERLTVKSLTGNIEAKNICVKAIAISNNMLRCLFL